MGFSQKVSSPSDEYTLNAFQTKYDVPGAGFVRLV
jgi:hypothetical protein